MEITDEKLVGKLSLLLPNCHRGRGIFSYNDTWRLAARSAIFRNLNAIEDAALEVDMEERETVITKAVDNVAALISYLEHSHRYLAHMAAEVMLEADHNPRRRTLQMGRTG